MEVGRHEANIISHEVVFAESGAVMVNMQIKFENGEVGTGRICMVKKSGEEMEKGIKDVQSLFGWTDGNVDTLSNATYDEIPCTVTVQMEEYNGRALPKINNVWPQRKKADPADIAKIQAKFGNVFKKFATTSGLKPLSAQTAVPAAKPEPTPAKPDADQKKPSLVVFEAFSAALGECDDTDKAQAWDDFLREVTGQADYDIDKITKPTWAKALKRVSAFIEERKQEPDADPFA